MNQISPYQLFLLECDEILRHKWLESEKRGYDIGSEEALVDWVSNHRIEWKKSLYASAPTTIPNHE
ncbi:MAG: DUF4032 domain-containing protein [Chthoniobacterales bacterium]